MISVGSPTKHTFTPGKLDYTIGGLPAPTAGSPHSGGQSMLFQNSAGTYFLFVWNSQVSPGGAAAQVTVHFNSHVMTQITEYDLTTNPASNTTPLRTVSAVSSLTIALTASVHLLVIKYRGRSPITNPMGRHLAPFSIGVCVIDRVIVYPGAIPLDTDILSVQRNPMIAFGMLMSALVGSVTVVSGLACSPTTPPSLQVTVGQGSIISLQTVDGSDFGSLPADTTDPLVKMGINLSPQTFALTAPTTSGQSVNYLIEANFQETDTNPVVLDYFDAADPTQPFSGPNNSGDQQNTLRAQTVSLQLKAGAAANTGTQVTPAVDAGWVGIWVVTVNFAQTAITGTSIVKYPNAPFLAGLLNSHHGGVPGQAPKINLATEVTGVLPSGNVSSILPINLAGGNTEVIGVLPLANQASQLPINLAGGSSVVIGVLPLANQASQLPINLGGGSAEVIGVLPLANQASQLPINLAGGAGQVVGVLPVGNMAFSQSLVGNGWSKDPNLKIIQWGSVTSVTGNGDVFNFPTAFPNACTAIVCLDDGPGIGDIGAAPANTSQFRLYAGFNNGGSAWYRSGIGVWFIAIGF